MIDDTRLPVRFWEKVSLHANGCWLWEAAKDQKGYGMYQLSSRISRRAHRVCYEALVGPVQGNLQLDHLCRVRACVNPDHLEPVTAQENISRGNTGEHCREKTECPVGHPLSGGNLYVCPRGFRGCRTCRKEAGRRAKERKAVTKFQGE